MKNIAFKVPLFLFALCLSAGIGMANPVSIHAEETGTDLTYTSNITDENNSSGDQTVSEDNSSENQTVTEEEQNSVSYDDVSNTTATTTTTTTTTTASKDTEETTTIKSTSSQIRQLNRQRWMNVCANMLKNLKKYHFRYGNGNVKKTFAKARSSGRRCNCALYVSWCLQKFGITKSGSTFYVRSGGSLRKNFHWNRNKVMIIRVNRKCKSIVLQEGDVVCWKDAHVNIYAGKSSSGKNLWYDGGKISTATNRNGSRYTKTGKKVLNYFNKRKISYIIRIKSL